MDVIVFPFHDWVKLETEGWVRRDTQIVRALCQRPEVRRVLVVNRPSSFPIVARALLRKTAWRTTAGRPVSAGPGWWVRQLNDQLFVLDILIPDLLQTLLKRRAWWGRALTERRTRTAVIRACSELGMSCPTIICFTPLATRMAASLPRRQFVFDAIDDWLEHPEMEPYRKAAAAGYGVARREADLITCVADELRQRFQGARGPVRWLPNGLSEEFFGPDPSVALDLTAIPQPRVGYVGVIEQRLDINMLVTASHRLPEIQFCFVGPYTPSHVRPLLDAPNCHFFGKRDFSTIRSYIVGFDVCLIPHKVNTFTRRMNPLKIYEYLALGKPVVASRVAGLELFEEYVLVADNADDFVLRITQALDEQNDLSIQRKNAVKTHSWMERLNTLFSYLAET